MHALSPAELIVVDRNPEAVKLAASIGAAPRCRRRRQPGRAGARSSPAGTAPRWSSTSSARAASTAEGLAMTRRAGDYSSSATARTSTCRRSTSSPPRSTSSATSSAPTTTCVELMALAAAAKVTLHTANYPLDDFQRRSTTSTPAGSAAAPSSFRDRPAPAPPWKDIRPMIFITAKFRVRPEDADVVARDQPPFTEATRAEPGCLWFDWSRSLGGPHRVRAGRGVPGRRRRVRRTSPPTTSTRRRRSCRRTWPRRRGSSTSRCLRTTGPSSAS